MACTATATVLALTLHWEVACTATVRARAVFLILSLSLIRILMAGTATATATVRGATAWLSSRHNMHMRASTATVWHMVHTVDMVHMRMATGTCIVTVVKVIMKKNFLIRKRRKSGRGTETADMAAGTRGTETAGTAIAVTATGIEFRDHDLDRGERKRCSKKTATGTGTG